MIVYHGSPAKFEKFNYQHIGSNGTAEGFGFYFTDKKHIAENYASNGFLYSVELDGKELSGSELTISKKEYIKLVKFLDKELEYLSNFGDVNYEGLQAVLNYAIELDYDNAENDAELLGGIVNASGSVETVCRAVYELLRYGYIKDDACSWGNSDGNQTVYIALVNDIIDVQKIEKVEL